MAAIAAECYEQIVNVPRGTHIFALVATKDNNRACFRFTVNTQDGAVIQASRDDELDDEWPLQEWRRVDLA